MIVMSSLYQGFQDAANLGASHHHNCLRRYRRYHTKLIRLIVGSWLMQINAVAFMLRASGVSDKISCVRRIHVKTNALDIEKSKGGRHQWDISVSDILNPDLITVRIILLHYRLVAKLRQPALVISLLGGVVLLFAKVTFFLMYLDIFRPMRWMRICSSIGAVMTSVFYIVMLIANLVLSMTSHGTPWEKLERPTVSAIHQATGGLLIDIHIWILPITAISKLQMSSRRRLGVDLIFVGGAL